MVGRGGGGGEGVVYGYGEHVHLLPLAGLLKCVNPDPNSDPDPQPSLLLHTANKSRNLFDMVRRGGGGGEGVVNGYGEHVHLLPLAGLLKGSLLQHLQLHAKSYS